jgi:hypothetical protein
LPAQAELEDAHKADPVQPTMTPEEQVGGDSIVAAFDIGSHICVSPNVLCHMLHLVRSVTCAIATAANAWLPLLPTFCISQVEVEKVFHDF